MKVGSFISKPDESDGTFGRTTCKIPTRHVLALRDFCAAAQLVAMTVGKWRWRFVQDRVEGLRDEPRPGPRTINGARIEATIVKPLARRRKAGVRLKRAAHLASLPFVASLKRSSSR